MSDTTENTENINEEGVEIMSLEDALKHSNSEQTEVEPAQETIEEEVQAETDVVEDVKEEETVEDVVEDTKEDVKVEDVAPKVEEKVEKDPYEGIDEEDVPYFKFKRNNPGTTRADFEDSLVDYDEFDRKELLRLSLREKYSFKNESDQDLDDYIEGELGIPMDSDVDDMTVTERVRLRENTDAYIQGKKEQHAKWAETKTEEKVAQEEQTEKMITLEDGSEMPEAKYNEIVEQRNNYVKNNEEALNRVGETSFSFTVDDNGEKRELKHSYEFDKEDKHRMLSISSDAVKHFNDTYQTKDGVNHEAMNENKAWEDPKLRGKMLSSFAQAIRAEAIEESMKDQHNINLGGNKGLQQQETKGIKYVPLSELLNN